MRFAFKAIATTGEIVSSDIDAPSKRDAMAIMAGRHLRLISISEVPSLRGRFGFREIWTMLTKKRGNSSAITGDVLLRFFVKLQKMIDAGLTLHDSLASIAKRAGNPAERALTNALLIDISYGLSFPDAIKNIGPKIGDSVYSMILVGEANGNLSSALADVVKLMRSGSELKKKMISSLVYPVFMATLAFVIIVVFAFVFVPRMESSILEMGGKLPRSSQIMKAFTHAFIISLPTFMALVAIFVLVAFRVRKTKIGRYKVDQLLLKIPPFSKIIPLISKTNLTNLMATLLLNGVNTSEALELSQTSIGNRVIFGKFLSAKTDILDGRSVCESFEKYGILDGDKCDLLAVGEKTGDLASAFKDVYEMYDKDLKEALRGLTVSTSSGAMLFAFAMVILLAASVVQSITGLAGAVS
ncbi:MAG: type II secretion system F family protein [Puniceicoccales bacterium]|jgi:type II secretory pathway component PulF|nr:type II secretion system F family protein [Puniceicoccales bacterium]